MWEIIFILPNLKVNEAFQNKYLAIVPHDHPSIKILSNKHSIIKNIVEGFTDQFMRNVFPCFLIMNSKTPDTVRKNEAFIGFRNLFAISCIIKAHEHSLTKGFPAFPLHSDYFDIYPITVSKDKKRLAYFFTCNFGYR